MDRHSELVDVIRDVRNRWRRRLALRGVVVVVAGTVLALLLSASGLESFRFSAPAIIGFRIIAFAVFAALSYWAFVRPLRRRVSDSQVAMYLEESNPQLEAAIISAIEASRPAEGESSASPRLVEKLVEQAVEQCRALDHRESIDRVAFRRHALTLAAVVVGAALVVSLGPAYLRHGLSALLVISRSAEAASPYHIEVAPGNAKVPKGGDQIVRAKLIGFTARDVGVMMRSAPDGTFERVPLIPSAGQTAAFEGMLFHLERPVEYYVESNGVLSGRFNLEVVDLPTVQQLDLEYHFPAYTGLAPRKVDSGGDVAAIRGTEVQLRVTPTMKTPDGRVHLNDGTVRPLALRPDGTLTGSFAITQQGFYKIELTGPHGEKVDASPQYTIDVIDDQPPDVRFTKPGRDSQASPVEELFLEARADDDYGVKQLQLFYSANGAAPKSVMLFGGGKPLTEVSAGHTIYLEELGLKPGDFVSYYAKATDTDSVGGPKTATSDIYFVQIRPFRKDYKPVQSQAMGGGGGQANSVGQLSQQQREIVAATFNAVRDKARTKPEKFRENIVFLNLAQAKLREQVEELVGKLEARLGHVDEGFNKIADLLPKAATEMKSAEGELKAMKADDALSPEQRALKLLQEAEQQYEVQVAMQQGGGGGGSQGAMAEDLADLFELELDKLANQYEMQNRAEQQGADRQVDELVEKLKELARRQQQEIERQRRLAQQSGAQGGGGGGGASQRQLAEELEKARRQLQQLTRDPQQQQNVADAMRRMQEAADAMRRAAANGSNDGGAQAAEALSRLREAQQKLERNQSGRGERDLQRAQRQADELANEQRQTQADVNSLDQAGAGRAEKAQQLAERKDSMDAKVADLQKQLEELANSMRRDEHDAARKLDEAAGSIRDNRIREKLRYSRQTLNGGSQYARGMEESLTANLDALSKKIGDAAAAMGKQAKQDAVGRAAEKTRDLVRNLESMDQRMRERARRGEGSQKGSKGSEGSQGSEGSEGSQGSRSSQGSKGSQASQGSRGSQDSEGETGGGQAAGGSPRNGGTYGGDNWGGPWNGNYGGYGYYNPEDVRQFRRDFREWTGDAQALRRQLQAAGVNPRELEDIIRDLERFDTDRVYADPKGLEMLQASAIDKLKKFEFSLRRKAEGGTDSLSLSGADQVPEGFRPAIEEYYRSLAKKQPQR